MATASDLSVREFQRQLKDEVKEIIDSLGGSYNRAADRGHAFQIWCARQICQTESTIDSNPDESVLNANDLKADIVLEDSAASRLVVCQTKYVSFDATVDESEVNDFFARHIHFCNRSWVHEHGSHDVVLSLGDYAERVEKGWTIDYYFITTARASQRTAALADECNVRFAANYAPVTCTLIDFSRLKSYYLQGLSLEDSIPGEVTLDLPSGCYFVKEMPRRTLIAVLKGNMLRSLYQAHRQSLYAWNIRGYLGARGINATIRDTAKNMGSDFFYFNNGVSAVCTEFHMDGNVLRAKKLQIINGAQTVSSLAMQEQNPKVEVLFRLTRTQSVSTEKGFNRDIIRFNNSQNQIKLSDFRSNDPIQVWLENKIGEVRARGALGKLRYLRKRGVGKRSKSGAGLRLEEFAKIRWAFFEEPTLVHSGPKDLWTLEADGGVYEKTFGVSGKLLDSWADDTFFESVGAVMLHRRVEAKVRELVHEDVRNKYLFRTRYHLLSLISKNVRGCVEAGGWKAVLHSEAGFTELFDKAYGRALNIVVVAWGQADEDGTTLFSFVRGQDRWAKMRRDSERRAAAGI